MIREQGTQTCPVQHADWTCGRDPGHDGLCAPPEAAAELDRETAVAQTLRSFGS